MMNRIPMTVKGAIKTREELEHLKKVERPRIIQAISEARAHGDLKENAEYHSAREQQSFIEGRIRDMESNLSLAQIIDITQIPNQGRVIFGVTVVLTNLENDNKVTYQIVGDHESNIEEKKISISSPLARAMIGKEEGETFEVGTPSGTINYEIVEIRHE